MSLDCPHDSLSGDEGPVALLGRMPVRWRCDHCGDVIRDRECDCDPAAYHRWNCALTPIWAQTIRELHMNPHFTWAGSL